MEEIWKSLSGLVTNGENYEVSTLGRIRSIDRITVGTDGRVAEFKGKILSTKKVKNNRYERVTLSSNGKTKVHYVHKLVGIAFIPNPLNKPQLNHIDGDTDNNKVSNLEWCTASENIQHAHDIGLASSPKLKGSKHGAAKLTEEKVYEIKKLLQLGIHTHQQIADMYDISKSTIGGISSNRKWRHVKC